VIACELGNFNRLFETIRPKEPTPSMNQTHQHFFTKRFLL